MYEVVETESNALGERQTKRLVYDADFSQLCPGTPIAFLWELWNSLKGAALPLAENFPLHPDFFFAHVHDGDPMKNRIVTHPGIVCGDWAGRTLGEHSSPLHRESVAKDYHFVAAFKQPSYMSTEQEIVGGVSRHYESLKLGLSDKQGKVTAIVYAYNYLSPVVISSDTSRKNSSADLYASLTSTS